MELSRRRCLQGLAAGAALLPLGRAWTEDKNSAAGAAPSRYVRFRRSAAGPASYGLLEGETVRELRGDSLDSLEPTDRTAALRDVKLVPPCAPQKVLALAGNYKSHLQGVQPVPKNPEPFIKAPSALLDPEGTILLPRGSADVHYEGELVVVIGKTARNVSPAEAPACIFGYTCGNDVSARDWQKNDRQWWRAKACDTFAPLGPWIVRGVDPGDLLLTTRLNGKEVQKARTSELIFGPVEVVSFISQHMTLSPGDIIYTGTPGTTSAMKAGDVVEVEIERIGVLRNRVG
jgi:2-keto-4-pentenoate hydratase/2-oxohepta-3-ene-1,7-dioic acid hydratase in catechol pathway